MTLLTDQREYFKKRSCFTLIRPVNDEKKLQQIAKLPNDEIRLEFRQQIEELKKLIYNNVKPKLMMGETLNGRSIQIIFLLYLILLVFVSLCNSFCASLNQGRIVIDTCWENVVKTGKFSISSTLLHRM